MSIQGVFGHYVDGKKDAAARVLYPVVIRIAKQAVWSIRRPELSDDVAQEFWVRVDSLAAAYDGSSPEEAYIYGCLKNIALELWRKNPHPVEAGDDGEDIHESIHIQAQVESAIDRKIATDTILKNMMGKAVTTHKETLVMLPFCQPANDPSMLDGAIGKGADITSNIIRPRPAPKKKNLSADHIRIREIRLSLDLTQGEYADALGLRTPTLVSYEQGQTHTVPEEVMARAEELFNTEGEAIGAMRSFFEPKSMSQILDIWAETLETDSADLATMAALIGTVASTISRWRTNECRPSLRELISYNKVVEKAAARIRRSNLNIDTRIVRE